jgi:Ribonuclease G/E
MSIHPTPALTAIDVDVGAATAAGGSKAAAQLALNRAVLPALATEIRLRNLSGAILVDLAGLPARRRAVLTDELAAALADDPLRPRLLGFTRLGLAEIVRPRIHPPLHEMLAGPHAAGLAALRQAAAEVAANPARALALRAAPPIVAALQGDPVALDDFARRAGRRLTLRADPSLPEGAWILELTPA